MFTGVCLVLPLFTTCVSQPMRKEIILWVEVHLPRMAMYQQEKCPNMLNHLQT